MFSKLSVLILSMGVIACVLLGIRQLRLQAAHEAADVTRRAERQNRDLWMLRAEIAKRVTPQQVEIAAGKFGVLVPLREERFGELVRLEREAAEAALDQAVTVSESEDRR